MGVGAENLTHHWVWEYMSGDAMSSDTLIEKIIDCLPIVADVSRADLLLYRLVAPDHFELVGQALPHSVLPLYSEKLVGQVLSIRELPAIFTQITHRYYRPTPQESVLHGTPIMREVRPVRSPVDGEVIGALSIETNVLAYERHRRRSHAFQRALRQLQGTAIRGEIDGADTLSPFGEHDGIYYVDTQRRIQYVNGIATNYFRRLGYMGKLVGRRLDSLATADNELASQVLDAQRCHEQENEEQDLIYIRKGIPVRDRPEWVHYFPALRRLFGSTESRPVGAMITIHDATEARRRERELKVKMALIQEVHHRVKNNLQTIASLLRIQSRRLQDAELQEILKESTNRILSVAVVHEFLSKGGNSAINVKDIGRRIIGQMQESLVDPEKRIAFDLVGPGVYLPARHATACALVINELLQNAVEHGLQDHDEGRIQMILEDEGELVTIHIQDDGRGLPPGFSVSGSDSLGLRIVQALVQDDLHGEFELAEANGGTRASVTFAKQVDDSGQI
jgi:two-component sensor histidine kinase